MADEQARHGRWWESGPIFSTTDRGSRITTVAPGERVGRFTPGLFAGTVLTAAAWTGLAFVGYPRLLGRGITAPGIEELASNWWWIGVTAVGVVLMFAATTGLYGAVAKRLRQQSAAFALCVTAAGFGCFAAGVLHLRILAKHLESLPADTPSWERPDAVILLLFTGIGLVAFVGGALWTPFLFLTAQRRQRAILRLRQSGHRYVGEVAATEFKNLWINGWPQFEVAIRYEAAHVRDTFDAVMSTRSHRVPLPGFPVVIRVGAKGATLVEPDPDRPGAFDKDYDRYIEPSGGGGGGA